MLAKLVGWYRRQRPDCPATCIHWQTWADVGMSTKADDVGMVKNELKMEFISTAEGCEHLHRELRAGLPEGEVLITDGYFQQLFYPQQLCDCPAPPRLRRRSPAPSKPAHAAADPLGRAAPGGRSRRRKSASTRLPTSSFASTD